MICRRPRGLPSPTWVVPLALVLFAGPLPLGGQEPTDSLRAELERLRAAAAAAAGAGDSTAVEADRTQEFEGRERSLQALNPEISVNADVFGQIITDDPDRENFFAREFEISLISNLDPFSRAKVFISRHAEGGEIAPFDDGDDDDEHGGEFTVEEGYLEWVGLPGGLGLKLGKFYQQFGQLNRWHAHALPSQSRSLAHLAFVGHEPLAQTGASVRWLAPFGGAAGTFEATVEVTRSENHELFGESGGPSVLGHLNGFWNLSSSLDFDLGLSWVRGSYEDETDSFDRSLLGAEMALTWRPPARALYRGFTLRGGVMALDGLAPVTPVGGGAAAPPAERAWGYWGSGELRLSQSWLVGARADRVESPEDPSEFAWLVAPTLTWWQSEYVRLRLEYDLTGRSSLSDTAGRFLLQVTFAMGPHRHEAY